MNEVFEVLSSLKFLSEVGVSYIVWRQVYQDSDTPASAYPG